MQVGHLLALTSADYDKQFQKGAEDTLKNPKKEKTAQADIFMAYFEQIAAARTDNKRPEKSVEMLKSELFESVSEIAASLFAKVKKSLKEGTNKGTIKLSNLVPLSWPGQSEVLRNLFQSYLGIELSDHQSNERYPTETLLTATWERSDQKLLTQLLGLAQQNIRSKTNDFRQKGDLCDRTLVVNNCEFHVHRLQLSKKSTYFERLFIHEFKEREQERIVIDDPTLSAPLFESILEFIYTGYTALANKNASQLILLSQKADMFDLPKLVFLCNRMLVTKLDKENWQEIAAYALTINDGQILKKHAAHFVAVAKSQIVKSLDRATIEQLCEYYELATGYESLAFIKERIATIIEESVNKDNFKELCELGVSLHSGSCARNLLEKKCKWFVEPLQDWLLANENEEVKNAYVKLCTGLVFLK